MDSDSALDAFRPKWPYPLGMVAGVVFAIGMFAFTYQLLSERTGQPSSIPLVVVCIGAAALGTAWFGILKMDQGGFGPAGGNIFLALAVAYMLSRKSGPIDEMLASAIVLVGAFGFCALGHIFAKGANLARIVGGVAGTAIAILMIADRAQWRIGPDTAKAIFVVGFGGLAVLGLASAHAFYTLRSAPRGS